MSRRGDIVLVALPGDFGKPRPAVVVQSDILTEEQVASTIVCPLTSTLAEAPSYRLRIQPGPNSGLARVSEIMADKVTAVPRSRLRATIGRLDADQTRELDRAIVVVLGIGQRLPAQDEGSA